MKGAPTSEFVEEGNYRLLTKFWEGNVFTGVCHSVYRERKGEEEGPYFQPRDHTPDHTSGIIAPPPGHIPGGQAGWYASYWNAFLFGKFFCRKLHEIERNWTERRIRPCKSMESKNKTSWGSWISKNRSQKRWRIQRRRQRHPPIDLISFHFHAVVRENLVN